MWAKTLTGIFFGLILSMSLFVNIGYFVPMPRDVLLFSGYVGIFMVWAGFASWFYCSNSLKQPMKLCIPLFIFSVVANGLYYTGII